MTTICDRCGHPCQTVEVSEVVDIPGGVRTETTTVSDCCEDRVVFEDEPVVRSVRCPRPGDALARLADEALSEPEEVALNRVSNLAWAALNLDLRRETVA